MFQDVHDICGRKIGPYTKLAERLREYYVGRGDCRAAAGIIEALVSGGPVLELNGIPVSLRTFMLLNAPINNLMEQNMSQKGTIFP